MPSLAIAEWRLLYKATLTNNRELTGPEGPDSGATAPPYHPILRSPLYVKSPAIALAIVLAGMLLPSIVMDGPEGYSAHAQAADSSLDFYENGTGPVGTFRAYDQDGDPIEWSLAGPDDDLFSIEGGVLTFRDPPDYEDPQSQAGGNLYSVTIVLGRSNNHVMVWGWSSNSFTIWSGDLRWR